MPSTRNRAWADRRISMSLVATVPQAIDLLLNAPTVDTLTAVRVIVDILCFYSPDATVVDSLSFVDLAVGVTSVEAFAVAAAAGLPNPTTESGYPPRGWLYVNTKPVFQQAESTGVLIQTAHFMFDVRSMRKVDKGVLFLIAENNTIIVGGVVRMVGRTRVLCLT